MKSSITILVSSVIIASVAWAQTAPAQSPVREGVWNMDPSKSDFGPMPTPEKLTITISNVKGPVFELDQESPEGTIHFVLRSDKQETVNGLPDGSEMKSRYWVEANALLGEIAIGEAKFKDKISYSPDGTVMTMDRDVTSPDGPAKIKIVFVKAAPPRPSLAGFWKLDAAKSDFGGPAPSKYEAKITVDGHLISMQQSTGEGEFAMKMRDDGQETTNDMNGMTVKSKMRWENDVFVGEHVYSGRGFDMTMKDRTTFSPDGKVLTINRIGKMADGTERKMRIVMVKQ